MGCIVEPAYPVGYGALSLRAGLCGGIADSLRYRQPILLWLNTVRYIYTDIILSYSPVFVHTCKQNMYNYSTR